MWFSSSKVSTVGLSLFLSAFLIGCGVSAALVATAVAGSTGGGNFATQDQMADVINSDLGAFGLDTNVRAKDVFAIIGWHYTYDTRFRDGNETKASGLMRIPVDNEGDYLGDLALPIVLDLHDMYLHKKDYDLGVANSDNHIPGDFPYPKAEVENFSGLRDYILLVPDYIGIGRQFGNDGLSDELTRPFHPYMIKESLVHASVDMLRSAKTYFSENNITFNGKVFLVGSGEGGYAAIAVAQEIEENHGQEFTVAAVAAIGGPYDLWTTLENTENLRFKEELNASYGVFYGSSVIDDEQVFKEKVDENSLHTTTWRPRTPIRLYHCDTDTNASFVNAEILEKKLSANGAQTIELISNDTICDGDDAYNNIADWFDTF